MPMTWDNTVIRHDFVKTAPKNYFPLTQRFRRLIRAINPVGLMLVLLIALFGTVWGFAVYGFMRWVNG